jgi:hypothetical protein
MPRAAVVPKAGPPRRLARAAYLLFGPSFIGPLAMMQGVDRKTVQRWMNGHNPVPEYAWKGIGIALRRRRDELDKQIKEIG